MWPWDSGNSDGTTTTHCTSAVFLLALFAQGFVVPVFDGPCIHIDTRLSSEAMLLLLRLAARSGCILRSEVTNIAFLKNRARRATDKEENTASLGP